MGSSSHSDPCTIGDLFDSRIVTGSVEDTLNQLNNLTLKLVAIAQKADPSQLREAYNIYLKFMDEVSSQNLYSQDRRLSAARNRFQEALVDAETSLGQPEGYIAYMETTDYKRHGIHI